MRWLGVITILVMLNAALAAGTPVLQTSTTQAGISPGNEGAVIVTISNLGTDPAYDTKLVLTSLDSPLYSESKCNDCEKYSTSQQICLEYKNQCYFKLGDISEGYSKDASFRITIPEDISSGIYLATFHLEYTARNSTTSALETRREKINTVLNIQSASTQSDINIKSISSPQSVKPGEEFNITIQIQNNGDFNAKSVTTELVSGVFKTTGTTNKIIVGDISSGSTNSVTYNLVADSLISFGLHEIGIVITYSDDENTYSTTSNTGLVVGGETNFNIFIQDISPEIIVRDSEISVLISIANIGGVNAESVSIILNPSEGVMLGNLNEDFLGDLDSGDYTTTNFDITPEREGEINLNLTISYITPNGKSVSFNTTERIVIAYGQAPITGPSGATNLAGWLIFISIAGVIAYFFYRARINK